MRAVLTLALVLCCTAEAATKEELALQQKLTAAEAEKSQLLVTLRQLAAQESANKARAQAATAERSRDASAAVTDAANLQFTAQYYAEIARLAAEKNNADLVALKQGQSDPFSASHLTLYTMIGGILLAGWKEWLNSGKRESEHREVLETVDRGTSKAAEALEHSNNQTQKIVDMREDLVGAVKATNAALEGKEAKR